MFESWNETETRSKNILPLSICLLTTVAWVQKCLWLYLKLKAGETAKAGSTMEDKAPWDQKALLGQDHASLDKNAPLGTRLTLWDKNTSLGQECTPNRIHRIIMNMFMSLCCIKNESKSEPNDKRTVLKHMIPARWLTENRIFFWKIRPKTPHDRYWSDQEHTSS